MSVEKTKFLIFNKQFYKNNFRLFHHALESIFLKDFLQTQYTFSYAEEDLPKRALKAFYTAEILNSRFLRDYNFGLIQWSGIISLKIVMADFAPKYVFNHNTYFSKKDNSVLQYFHVIGTCSTLQVSNKIQRWVFMAFVSDEGEI